MDISKAAPWAIYGVFLIGFMYAMPRGIAGSIRLATVRWLRRRAEPRGPSEVPRGKIGPTAVPPRNRRVKEDTMRKGLLLALLAAFGLAVTAARRPRRRPV